MGYEPIASDTALAEEVRAAHEHFNMEVAAAEARLQNARARILASLAAAETAGLRILRGPFDHRLQADGRPEPFLQSANVPVVARMVEI